VDIYSFLVGLGLFLLGIAVLIYQYNDEAFKDWRKLGLGDIQLFFAAALGLIFGPYYMITAF
jgi:hypothetical protein